MKKYIIEPEYDGYEIGTYLKETKGYSGRGLRNLEIYLNGKRVKNNSKKVRKLNRLHIREKEKETGHYIRKERYSGACERSFYVGEELEQSDIKAEFKHGILKLFVPKKEAKKEVEGSKYIAIEG